MDEDGSSLRVASFNCYLDPAKESLVRSLSAQDSNKDAFSFSHNTEIGVFGADRYFNTKLDYHTNTKSPVLRAPAATPSFCSDTTSAWNSQTTLLPPPHPMKQKKAMATRLFMGFACRGRGPCFDKKSVHTSCPHPPPKIDESRRSIEVFGSRRGSSKGGDVATNMERKLSMLTWDAIPIPKPIGRSHPPTSTSGSATLCDAASDASSDLFEIEDVSGTIYPSTCMSPATSLYAPSEASIQWSVVTASAADFSTALSDFNDDSVSAAKTRNVQKTRPSGLLGCKSLKSVDVVAHNVCVKPTKP